MMPRLIILRGIPASGKTNLAMELVKDGCIRVNKDDLRAMFFGGYSIEHDDFINPIALLLIDAGLGHGFDVISDNTNLPGKFFEDQISLADKMGIEIVIKNVIADVDICIKRDKERNRTVGEEVVRNFEKVRHGDVKPCPYCNSQELMIGRMGPNEVLMWSCRCGQRWPYTKEETQ